MPGPIGTAINAGMGLLLQGHNDRRQVKQEGRLLEQQLGFDFKKMDKNLQNQKNLWEATSYPAQIEQMKKAGLSPGLMYGMSGQGGATTGSTASGVQGGKSAPGQNEIMGLQLMEAQKNLIEAQTGKAKAETEKTTGVDTAEAQTRIESLTQGIQNQKAAQRLTNIQGDIGEIEVMIKEGSYEDVMNTIGYTARQAEKQLGLLSNEKEISDKTKDDKVKLVQGELIGLGLANELKKLNADLTEEQIKKVVADVSQGWKSLSIQGRNAATQEKNAQTGVRQYTENVRRTDYEFGIKEAAQKLMETINDVPNSDKIKIGFIENLLRMVKFRN